jgi:tubulin delta
MQLIQNNMAIVTLQLGQCGNQLGFSFFDNLNQECARAPPALSNAIRRTFFYEDSGKTKARAILIDMEPKVVNQCLSSCKSWEYDPQSSFCQQEGSGNNWALGYNVHGSKWVETILDRCRRQLEECETLRGILIFQSLAGGTGSGVGTKITESLRDEMGNLPMINIAIWPYSFGEVILQNYNTALTLSHLIHAADGLILIQNDWLEFTTRNCLGIKNIDFEHMNTLATRIISSIIAPVYSPSVLGSCSQFAHSPYQGLLDLCSTPGYPLLNIVSTPIISDKSVEFSDDTWSGLIKRAYQMMISNTQEPNINWNINSRSGDFYNRTKK